jgi:hypothetical protein
MQGTVSLVQYLRVRQYAYLYMKWSFVLNYKY